MKRTALTIGAILLIQGLTFAHEGENHTQSHNEHAQMDKLHKMMTMSAQAQAKIDEALLNGDTATIKK